MARHVRGPLVLLGVKPVVETDLILALFKRSRGTRSNERKICGPWRGHGSRQPLCSGRLGSGARQIWLKIKLISRLGAGPFARLFLSVRCTARPVSPPREQRARACLRPSFLDDTRANRRNGTEEERRWRRKVDRRSSMPPTRT